jgi:biotin-dependent carboxylase-like uncharacterized protein
MSPALRVLSPGLWTTVQDLGRIGYQHLGIPISGALDPVSLRAANVLVGNAPETAALEVAYVGPAFTIEADDVRMAFVGAQAAIEVLADERASAGTLVESMESIHLKRGNVVRIGSLVGATTLYVAVEGGFDIAPVLGSASTYVRGSLGGWQGRALEIGDRLPLLRGFIADRDEFRLEGLELNAPSIVRVVAGPQNDYFSSAATERFLAAEYTVGAGSDRMGMRLDGPKIEHARGHDITSDAIAPGSIQISGSGKPIVLLADRQTTGGYPKIATVVSADLPALGRLPIGAKFQFEAVTLEEAVEARRQLFAELESLPEKLVPISLGSPVNPSRLFDANLISGFVDAESEIA